jgi:hypothetical protein
MSRNRGPEHRAMRIWKMGRSGAQSPILSAVWRYNNMAKDKVRSLADQVIEQVCVEVNSRSADAG